MEEILVSQASEYGIWALMFVVLFSYVIYDSRQREEKYRQSLYKNQEIILELSRNLKVVDNIQKSVCDINKKLDGR